MQTALDHVALLDLPTDRPRGAVAGTGRRRAAAARTAAPGGAWLTAVAAWLHRVCGQADVAFVVDEGREPRALTLELSGQETLAELTERIADALPAAPTAPDGAQVLVTLGEVSGEGTELTIALTPGEIVLDGDAGLFDAGSLERFAGHIARIEAAPPATALRDVELLSDDERETVLHRFNQTAVPFSDGARVHELIAAQAARDPDRVAVTSEQAQLTYAELDAAANRLAHHLAARGVEPGGRVGVHLQRSERMLVAVLGVMKAGAAYVPLDPSFPPDRLRYMAEDAGLTIVVTESELRGRLGMPGGTIEVCLDDEPELETRPEHDPQVPGGARDAIYVIYTSGSTGRPKGVVLEHRSVVNFLEAMAVTPGLGPDDVLVAVTTLSFDIAVLELYLPLVRGARVVIAPRQTTVDGQGLVALIARERATVMQATPATWRMLVDAGWSDGDTPALRAYCGGEALPGPLAEQLCERAAEVWNLYGPTETTVWSTVQQVHPGDPVTIGHPIANTTLYVLDERRKPVPLGVAGELYIGGDGLARGYHERDELTAERFVPDPFVGERMYRTGDLVRRRADGRLEFIGRADNQVKVRGFRIELGEIESILNRHDEVDEAVVLALSDPRGEAQLVAYVTAARGQVVTRTELRRSVGRDLPAYMVPAQVVVLDAMPRTPNGKTDRKALPAPDFASSPRDGAFVAPRDETERRLVAVWEQELGLESVSIDDDLFTLGVSSLATARLVARIEREFRAALPVGAVFAAPTVRSQARLLLDGVEEPVWPSLVAITEGDGARPPVFGVHGGAGTVLFYAELARRLAPARGFYGLHAQGLFGRDPVHTSIPQMADAYLRQIREVQPHGPYALLGYCFGGHVAVALADRLAAAGEEVALVGLINAPSIDYIREHAPQFDADGPLTGRDGARLRPAEPAPAAGRPRRAARVRRKVRTFRQHRQAALRFRLAVRLGRPLPQNMREEYWFQRLAHRAEREWTPPTLSAPLVVWRARGLYFRDDLGWGRYATGPLSCEEVAADRPTPRATMDEPAVSHLARSIERALGATAERAGTRTPAATPMSSQNE